ncbi:MAG: DUF2147 domain-containing protein [Oricola sp.]
MIRRLVLATAIAGACTVPALADPIEGVWRRPSTGALVRFQACGASFCGIVQSGEFAGRSIGKMSGSGGSYAGTITDLAENKTYKGKASVKGNTMNLKGCVLGGLICKGENWTRQ